MRVLSLALVVFSAACGRPYVEPAPAYRPPVGYDGGGGDGPQSVEATDEAVYASASPVRAVSGVVDFVAGAVSNERPEQQSTIRSKVAFRRPMMMVEADAGIAVDEIVPAADKIRALTEGLQGTIVGDEVLLEAQRATFVLRIPPDKVEELFAQLEEVGDIRHRRISAKDVSKRFVDNTIRLDNLTKELERFQQLLSKAAAVKDMLEIERELNRVRGQIEQIKGQLAYLRDKVAMATVTIGVTLKDTDTVFAPRAKFHPGLRYGWLGAYARGAAGRSFYGPGFSLHIKRWWSLSVDLLSDANRDLFRADAIVALFGAEAYSDFLGRGKRSWLNPYVGLAAGYARFDEADNFAAGGSFGVELFKMEHVLVDANARVLGLFGDGQPQIATQGTLSINVAF